MTQIESVRIRKFFQDLPDLRLRKPWIRGLKKKAHEEEHSDVQDQMVRKKRFSQRILKSQFLFILASMMVFFSASQSQAAFSNECSTKTSEVNQLVREKLKVASVAGQWVMKEHRITMTIPQASRVRGTIVLEGSGKEANTEYRDLSTQVCRTQRGIRVTLYYLISSVQFEIYLEGSRLKFKEIGGEKRSGEVKKS